MVDILPQTSDCIHVGDAMWIDHYTWWCGNCGITVYEIDFVNDLQAHKEGELWQGR